MAHLDELNRNARERAELDRRVGLRVRPVVLEEATAVVGRHAVSGDAAPLSAPGLAVASSSTDGGES